MMMDLTDNEINEICGGYVQNAAKIRFLLGLGLTVRRKPNGRPLVNRSHYESVMGCGATRENQKLDCQPVWGVH